MREPGRPPASTVQAMALSMTSRRGARHCRSPRRARPWRDLAGSWARRRGLLARHGPSCPALANARPALGDAARRVATRPGLRERDVVLAAGRTGGPSRRWSRCCGGSSHAAGCLSRLQHVMRLAARCGTRPARIFALRPTDLCRRSSTANVAPGPAASFVDGPPAAEPAGRGRVDRPSRSRSADVLGRPETVIAAYPCCVSATDEIARISVAIRTAMATTCADLGGVGPLATGRVG